MWDDNKTIFALATAQQKTGVAVIRISGEDCLQALQIFGIKGDLPPRKAIVRQLYENHEKGDLIDKALLIYFPAPHSFTGESTLEIQPHGSLAVIRKITEMLCLVKNFRMAMPGEFAKRAFKNGKMDLIEAEGLGDLIEAETKAQHQQAVKLMRGDISKYYNDFKQSLVKNLAFLESFIDFPEEDIPSNLDEQITREITALKNNLSQFLQDKRGFLIRSGVDVAIIGKPNVGKSSLFNIFAKKQAAIVTDVAGTTRDAIEIPIEIAGIKINLIDTAGIRQTNDKIEKIGIKLAKERATQADILILMCDATEDMPDTVDTADVADTANMLDNFNKNSDLNCYLENFETDIEITKKPDFILINKIDKLPSKQQLGLSHSLSISGKSNESDKLNKSDATSSTAVMQEYPQGGLASQRVFPISIMQKTGLDEFFAMLQSFVANIVSSYETPMITRLRHKNHIQNCIHNLESFLQARAEQQPIELLAEDVRLAARELGEITGHTDVEQLLDVIFSSFCIGK